MNIIMVQFITEPPIFLLLLRGSCIIPLQLGFKFTFKFNTFEASYAMNKQSLYILASKDGVCVIEL